MDAITRLNPIGLHATPGYHHVTVSAAGRTAYLAGQCPLDTNGTIVGLEDPLEQADQVAANAMVALAAIGARPEQMVRSVIYVVSTEPKVLSAVWQRFHDSPLAAAFSSASTLLGVTCLGFPGQLVELDLTAALGPGPKAG